MHVQTYTVVPASTSTAHTTLAVARRSRGGVSTADARLLPLATAVATGPSIPGPRQPLHDS